MLVERRDQYKMAAVKAKQAGNEERAIEYIRTAKVTLLQIYISGLACAFYFAYGRDVEYCDPHVCLFICLSVCLRILETTCPKFTKFSVHVNCGHGSIMF